MTPRQLALKTTQQELMELIAALDRRLPQVARTGETAIVNAAQQLRVEALKRIAEIERDLADRASPDTRSANIS